MIYKIVTKSMRKKKILIFSIIILLMLSSMFMFLKSFVYDKELYNIEKFSTTSNVEDFRLYTLNNKELYTKDMLNEIEKEHDVELDVEKKIDIVENNFAYTIFNYDENSTINNIILEDGKLPTSKNEIIVQPPYMEVNNLKIGDSIKIEGYDYKIVGSGYFSNDSLPINLSQGVTFTDFTKAAPIFMQSDSYEEIQKSNPENIIVTGKFSNQNMTDENMKKEVDSIVSENTFETPKLSADGNIQLDSSANIITKDQEFFVYSIMRADNLNIDMSSAIESDKYFISIMSFVMIILSVLLIIVLINSVFKSQRREMGILKAEGVSKNKLANSFLVYFTIILLIGFALGIILSYFLSKSLLSIYNSMLIIPQYKLGYDFYSKIVIEISIIISVMLILIYIIGIYRNINENVLNLIKNISTKKEKYKQNKFTKKLSFLRRFQVNIILRNISKSLLLFFGVFIASFLLLMGALMYSSVNQVVNSGFSEVYKYEYMINHSAGYKSKENSNNYLHLNVELKSTGTEYVVDSGETITLEAYDFENSKSINLHNKDGKVLSNNNGLVATDSFLSKYNLKVGDSIKILNPYDANQELTLKIVDSTDEYFMPNVYADINWVEKIFGESNIENVEVSMNKLDDKVKTEIKDLDPNAQIIEATNMEEQIQKSMQIITASISMITVISAIIGFISLYTVSTIIIESNEKTISVMKVLGYSNSEVKKMTIGIYKYFVGVIYLLSIPIINILIQQIINKAFEGTDYNFTIHMDFKAIIAGLIVIYLIYFISSYMAYKKIKKISLAKSLNKDE